jgi:hypothetical protein
MDGVDDRMDDAVVDEEVLAEAFARGVHLRVRDRDSRIGFLCGV